MAAPDPPSPPTASEPAEEASFAELLSEFEQHQAESAAGETVEGTVLQVDGANLVVDIGRKREGLLPIEEVTGPSGELEVKPGDSLDVSVAGRSPEGYYRLSRLRVKRPIDWASLEAAFSAGNVIAGVVSEVIKGGLRVDVGARAFLPASRSGARDDAEMEALVGQEIRCKVIQLDTAKEDVVVDRRAVLQQEAAAERDRAFSELAEGNVITGTVRSLTDFGAFVDIGGVDGLLHVTDMAWERVGKPSDIVSEGEKIEVKVLKVDPQARRISLGRKQLIPDPWTQVAEKYPSGVRARGTVKRLTGFGAFVELEPGVEGLVHVSEMSWSKKHVKPSDIVRKGESVEVVVLNTNPAERRIRLGLKQALGDPWQEASTRFPVGAVVEGPISNLAKFGAFVELGDGLEGMIHIGDITNEKHLDHPNQALSAGQVVRAAVLEVDPNRQRIRLGMKQLQPTAADEYIAEHSVGDVVTGRVVDSRTGRVKVDLGEGVVAACRIKEKGSEATRSDSGGGEEKPDLAALSAMLASRWKQGSASAGTLSSGFETGQVREFRIVSLDGESKRIEVEPL